MRSEVEANQTDQDWLQVTSAAPCPICGSARSCCIHVDEAFACCTRQPSDWRLSNGGWLHRIEVEAGEREGASEMPQSRSLRDSGIVVRDAPGGWIPGATAVGSST